MIRLFAHFIVSFLRVTWAHFWGYRVLDDVGEAPIRYLSCLGCPAFDGVQCKDCGCLAQAKTMILVESCPRKKWPAVWIKRVGR